MNCVWWSLFSHLIYIGEVDTGYIGSAMRCKQTRVHIYNRNIIHTRARTMVSVTLEHEQLSYRNPLPITQATVASTLQRTTLMPIMCISLLRLSRLKIIVSG